MTPNPRCVEQLAFLLMHEPEQARGRLLAETVKAIARYGREQGWLDPEGFAAEFAVATSRSMHRLEQAQEETQEKARPQ
jgi:hypothetical protein